MVVNTIVFMVNHLVNDYEDNYIYIFICLRSSYARYKEIVFMGVYTMVEF
jgi:hypothetical protein